MTKFCVMCPCSKSKGFKRFDHFQNHLNTLQHKQWVKNNIRNQKENTQNKEFRNDIKFLFIFSILMYYWFVPIKTFLTFMFLERNGFEPIYETMSYDDVYNRYIDTNVSFGGLTISW